jgi:phosphatidate cytidylyltransferase
MAKESRGRVALLMIATLLACLRFDFLRLTVLPALTALLGVMGAREMHRMAGKLGIQFSRPVAMTLSGGIVLMGVMNHELYAGLLPVVLTGAMMLVFTMQMRVYGIPGAYTGVASSLLTLLYVAVPLSLALQVLQYDRLFLFFSLIMIWSADSGAYFVGRKIGRTKLAPSLSPKKTVEGLLGGVAACCLVALAFKLAVPSVAFEYPLRHVIPLAALLGFAAPTGDLAESVLKRDCGVKDSGHSLGGHGGVLDRIDSMFFCMPICYGYLRFFVWPFIEA